MGLNSKVYLLCLIAVFLLSISAVFASDIDSNKSNALNSTSEDIISDDEIPDVPDLVEEIKYNVTPSNIDIYFKNGVLDNQYNGNTLIFSGDFENLNKLTIQSSNVKLIGLNAKFKNTVFNIESNNVEVCNFSFDLNKAISSNNGAVISVSGSHVTLMDLDIKYIVPNDVEAYAILADGYNNNAADFLKIINSTIYFEGHNFNTNKYNCVIKLTWADGVCIENNNITSLLPLKNVNYGPAGETLDSDYVYTIGLEKCSDFVLKNNLLVSDVNKRTAVTYPTQSCIILTKSDNGLVLNNSIYMTDFVTYFGVENYLYGLDIYNLNNLLVMGNKISIITTGGKLALGTAYPIQISGPVDEINITRNDLYSFSNGPNIGIYSFNYFGTTTISITYNKINVTGLAGTHEWALVTGIESQDSNSEILNNYIEVHSVGDVNEDDNLYAISYRQSTPGAHTYNIQNNFALTDGYYAVYLLTSDHSTIMNNTLVSSNNGVNTGDDSYSKEGIHTGDVNYNNVVISLSDYYNSNRNIIVGPINNYDNSKIDGQSISWNNPSTQNKPTNNPLVPYYSNNNHQQNKPNTDSTSDDNYVDDGTTQGKIGELKNSGGNAKSSRDSENNFKSADNEFVQGDVVNDYNVNSQSNGSSSSPSLNGNNEPLASSQSSNSAGGSKSASKSVYELEDLTKDEKFIPSVFVVMIILFLLIVGFKRKNPKFKM